MSSSFLRAVLCSSAIAAFCMLSKWGKQCRQRTKPREQPSASDASPALPRRGGAIHPTASPRKWKFWRKASAADDVYGDARGGRGTPSSLPDASSSHSRSASVLSGTSSLTAGHAFPVVSVVTSPPAARIVELPHNIKPSL
ncbi:hypothetical protein BD413DRAFT_616708 [Trametes elegans]|nr:hypothetical protein BD413DRAFT_616708 [Trametes elegans]